MGFGVGLFSLWVGTGAGMLVGLGVSSSSSSSLLQKKPWAGPSAKRRPSRVASVPLVVERMMREVIVRRNKKF